MEALARLTEKVFTRGRMDYGVQTEAVLEGLAGRLDISGKCQHSPDPMVNPTVKPAETVADQSTNSDPQQASSSVGGSAEASREGGSDAALNDVLDTYVQLQLKQLLRDLPSLTLGGGGGQDGSILISGGLEPQGESPSSSSSPGGSTAAAGPLHVLSRIEEASKRGQILIDETRRRLNVPDNILTAHEWMGLKVGSVSMQPDGKMYTNLGLNVLSDTVSESSPPVTDSVSSPPVTDASNPSSEASEPADTNSPTHDAAVSSDTPPAVDSRTNPSTDVPSTPPHATSSNDPVTVHDEM